MRYQACCYIDGQWWLGGTTTGAGRSSAYKVLMEDTLNNKDAGKEGDNGNRQCLASDLTTHIDYPGGKPKSNVTVPSLVGGYRSEAVDLITQYGLEPSVTEVFHSSLEGTVVSQSPAASSEVPAGSTVTIEVSKGPSDE